MIEDPRRDAIHARFLYTVLKRAFRRHGAEDFDLPVQVILRLMEESLSIIEEAEREQNELKDLDEHNKKILGDEPPEMIKTNFACPACGERVLRYRGGRRNDFHLEFDSCCSSETCDWFGLVLLRG